MASKNKASALLDTRAIYCGDNLEQLKKLPDGCVDLVYIDPPFNSNRNYEVFWGETKEKRSFDDRHYHSPLRDPAVHGNARPWRATSKESCYAASKDRNKPSSHQHLPY